MRALEELRHKVWSSRSLRYLDESIAAYNAGAYRAAILSVWVAVVADLIEKVRILADNGEPEAEKKRRYLDGAIENRNVAQMQSFERDALDLARSLELIGSQEKLQLERLRDDRNICAHPGYIEGSEDLFDPGPELVRAHIVGCIDTLLAHPPVTGRKAIERFLREIGEQSFPGDFERLDRYLRVAYVDHGSESLKANLCKVVFKQCLSVDWVEDRAIARRLTATLRVLSLAMPAIFETNLETFLYRTQDTFNDDQLLTFAASMGRVPLAWQKLNDGARGRLEQRIESAQLVELLARYELFQPIPAGPIGDLVVERFSHYIINEIVLEDRNPEVAVVVRHADRRIAGLLVCQLSDASSFRRSEVIMSYLVDCSAIVTAEQVGSIADSYLKNRQIWEAFNAAGILHELWIRTNSSAAHREAWDAFVARVHDRLTDCRSDEERYWRAVLQEVGPDAPPF